jgi:broad specificity phosphatase PhoE
LGEDQARQAAASFDGLNVECVVVSPLRRAVHTALLALPSPGKQVRWEIWPELREFLEASADLGSDRSELSVLFPSLPWQTLPEGVWWFEPDDDELAASAAKTPAERVAASRAFFKDRGFIEPPRERERRAAAVVRRLREMKASSIAVVGHSDMLNSILERFGRSDYWMANAEVLTVDLEDCTLDDAEEDE